MFFRGHFSYFVIMLDLENKRINWKIDERAHAEENVTADEVIAKKTKEMLHFFPLSSFTRVTK